MGEPHDGERSGRREGAPRAERTIDVTPAGEVRSVGAAGGTGENERQHAAVTPTRGETALDAPGGVAGAAAGLTRTRKVLALLIAAASDAVSVFSAFAPPVQLAIDGVTAALLFWVLGFRWPLLPALAVEAIPGLAVFPTWSIAVGVLVGVTPTAPSAPRATNG